MESGNTETVEDTINAILDEVFAVDSREEEGASLWEMRSWISDDADIEEDIDEDEVEVALDKSKPGKAPGGDCISVEMIKSVWQVMGREILNLFNRCKQERAFPRCCKEGRLVLLPKKVKDPRSGGTYRPHIEHIEDPDLT